MILVPPRLAQLAVADTSPLRRLLPMGGSRKDVEILALRNPLLVPRRQVGEPAFTDTDRAVPAGVQSGARARPERVALFRVRPKGSDSAPYSGGSVFLNNGSHGPEKEAPA